MADRPTIAALLIEDDPADAGLVRHALRSLGDRFALTHRMTLRDGLEWVAGNHCDVVLLDLTLPDSSGFDTIRRMYEACPAMPVIVLTGHDDEDFAMAAVAAGTQDYLFKGNTDGQGLQRAIRYAIARKQMEEKLRQSEQRLLGIVTQAQDAIVSVDQSLRIVLFNPAAERMFGYTVEEILGRPLSVLLPEQHRTTHDALAGAYAISGSLVLSVGARPDLVGLTRDGREFPVEISISKTTQQNGMLLTAIVRDITERKRFENDLRILATTDPLTGLANRRTFLTAAKREMVRVRRYGRPAAVLMVDIDHFKRINDTHGHAIGDQALQTVATVCSALLRNSDLVGRLGGEEFGVLLPETDPAAALEVAERLRATLEAAAVPLPGGGGFHLTASIGVAACNQRDGSVEHVLGRADRALYRAKDAGRNRVEAEISALTTAP